MPAATANVRATQSFVHTLSSCRRRPALTAIEVAWRWVYGIPAVALIGWQLDKVLLAATGGTMDPARIGLDKPFLNDPVGVFSAAPMEAAAKISGAVGQLLPGLLAAAHWLLPLLVAAWIVVSAVGRTLLLRRADGALRVRVATLIALHAVRVAALGVVLCAWIGLLHWSAKVAIAGELAAGREPDLILYCALVIVSTLALFTAWAFASWLFFVAPLLAMPRDLGAGQSLLAAARLGPVRGRLIEVNLVAGIIKIALIVLAMVFSATPLPFETVTTNEFLAFWWAGIGVLYLLWSDFFHVVQLVAYLDQVGAATPRHDVLR